MNVVPIDVPDTLSIILDRGLIGMYHDWCESFNTYPRTYDLLHASFLFKHLEQRYAYLKNVEASSTVDSRSQLQNNLKR